MIRITAILSLCFVGLLNADPPADVPEAGGVHAKVDALMKAKRANEAAELLEKAVKENPDDVEALRKLGSIYAIVLKQPEKGAPLLEKGAKMGDKKSLRALAVAQLLMQDNEGMLAYKKQYIDNYENLSGSRVVCFHIAGLERDGTLFNELLRRTPEEDIVKDKGLSMKIARAAKALVENDQVEPAGSRQPAAIPESKPEVEEKPHSESEPATR